MSLCVVVISLLSRIEARGKCLILITITFRLDRTQRISKADVMIEIKINLIVRIGQLCGV